MSTERISVGWHWHRWTQWSEPYAARISGSPAVIQKRRCSVCNLHQFRDRSAD